MVYYCVEPAVPVALTVISCAATTEIEWVHHLLAWHLAHLYIKFQMRDQAQQPFCSPHPAAAYQSCYRSTPSATPGICDINRSSRWRDVQQCGGRHNTTSPMYVGWHSMCLLPVHACTTASCHMCCLRPERLAE
jgi:hypothetical protein